jgi:hypothetical protein
MYYKKDRDYDKFVDIMMMTKKIGNNNDELGHTLREFLARKKFRPNAWIFWPKDRRCVVRKYVF